MTKQILTQQELKTHVIYDELTGIFTRLISHNKYHKAGRLCKIDKKKKYQIICLSQIYYKAHRLAWLYVYGYMPLKTIDHINGNPYDNRLLNLRLCTLSENQQNSKIRVDNTTGYKGVGFSKSLNKYTVRCRANGKRHNLGYFDTAEKASEAYKEFAIFHHGKFYRET
jgi:hypothetical protein